MARQTHARLLKQRLHYERTVKTEAGDTEEAPPVPVHTDAPPVEDHPYHPVSPFDVGSHSMAQVEKADKFLEWCRWAIDQADEFVGSTREAQDNIRQSLRELAEKVKEGARVKAIGEGSLQVAAPLYLVFEVIIPVM